MDLPVAFTTSQYQRASRLSVNSLISSRRNTNKCGNWHKKRWSLSPNWVLIIAILSSLMDYAAFCRREKWHSLASERYTRTSKNSVTIIKLYSMLQAQAQTFLQVGKGRSGKRTNLILMKANRPSISKVRTLSLALHCQRERKTRLLLRAMHCQDNESLPPSWTLYHRLLASVNK